MGIFTLPAVLAKRIHIIPSGLIIPYNGTSAPSGWTLFTSANGKFIVGAGDSYSVGATGGSTSVTTGASNSTGAHTGTTFSTGGSSGSARGTLTAGSHSHTLSFNYTPSFYGLALIKSNEELLKLPAKAVMFSGKALSGLSRFSDGDGKLFVANSSVGSGGSNTISGNTSSTGGSHTHGSATSCLMFYYDAASAGAHYHPHSDFTITPKLYRALLSAWTDASNDFNLQSGVYAFYESTTPPTGWLLCDGNNGTLDLRNYFIEFTDEDDDGTREGEGKISLPNITLSDNSWVHGHQGTKHGTSYESYHTSASFTHCHTISASDVSFTPPYYALAIIQLAA